MLVTKRNGSLVEFDTSKIKNIISICCEGLDVSSLELESKLQSKFKDKIKTSDIQQELVNTAMSLVTVENPDWTIVAGRLEMYDLHRQIGKNCKIDYNTPFRDILDYMIRNNYYDKDILNFYTKEEIDKIGSFINPDYDWIYPISSIKSLKKKYLIKNRKFTVELPQVATLVTCMFLNKNEKTDRLKKIKEDYNAIASLKISLATPFKANLRKKNANLSSCFIVEMDDNAESILKVQSDIAKISGQGGGVGVYLGRLRPSASYIKDYPGGNNIVVWTKILNDMATCWNQQGTRQGAVTVSLDIWHKDIRDFIEIRTEDGGEVRLKCFDIFPQVILCNKFLEEVKNNGEFPLLDRHAVLESLKIDVCNIKEFNENYDKLKSLVSEKKIYNCELVNAKELWKRCLEIYIETGALYIANKDNVNRTNPWSKSEQFINSLNLCVESFSPARPSTIKESKYNKETNEYTEVWDTGLYHTCNLASLNVSRMKNIEEIEKYARQATRILDNAIDITVVPVAEGQKMSQENRTIGVGVMGLADYVAKNKLDYMKNLDEIEKIFEAVSFASLSTSLELAKEKGAFSSFKDTFLADGIFLGKTGEELENDSVLNKPWKNLMEEIKSNGVRNGMLVAVAPNTSTSLVCGCSASYLPVFNKFSYESMDKMNVPVVPQFLKDRFWYYKEEVNVPTKDIITITDRITKWIDTGISMELVISPQKDSIKEISDTLIDKFLNGNLKSLYYSRVIDNSGELGESHYCVSCAN